MKNFKNNFLYGSMIALLLLIAATFAIIQRPTSTSNTEAHSYKLTNCRLSCKDMKCVYNCLQGTFVKNTPTPITTMPTATPVVATTTVTVPTAIPIENVTTTTTTTATNGVNVKNYGAKGDGKTNDTAAIQSAINSLGSTGGTISIPSGTYMIDAGTSIKPKSNTNITMETGAILKAITNNLDYHNVILVSSVSNVNITGGEIVGDRDTHIGTAGESGFGINILGSDHINVTGTVTHGFWGDGFIIDNGPGWGGDSVQSSYITLTDVESYNNRRQGISVISGSHVSLIRPNLHDISGAPLGPCAGIDVEGNDPWDTYPSLLIQDAVTSHNSGAGILLNWGHLANSTYTGTSIIISGHHDTGSAQGVSVSSGWGPMPGTITINDSVLTGNTDVGAAVMSMDYRGAPVTFNRLTVNNTNNTDAIVVGVNDKDSKSSAQALLGNVHFVDTTVNKGTGPLAYGFYVYSAVSGGNNTITNVTIANTTLNGVTVFDGAVPSGVTIR